MKASINKNAQSKLYLISVLKVDLAVVFFYLDHFKTCVMECNVAHKNVTEIIAYITFCGITN